MLNKNHEIRNEKPISYGGERTAYGELILHCNNAKTEFVSPYFMKWDKDKGAYKPLQLNYRYCPLCAERLEVEER